MDILVDLDGTLVDPKPGLIGSIQYALQQLGEPVPHADELLWMIGPPFRVSFPKLLGRTDRTEEAIAHYRRRYFESGMYDAVVYHGVSEALDSLVAFGCRLYVATAKPHHYAKPILQHFDLARRFVAIHGPELDGTRDHKSDLIAHIIAEHRLRPETAIMVGDREHDIIAASRNGMRALGVTWGYGSREELTAAGAAVLCATPAELASSVLSLLDAPQIYVPTVQLSHR
jgi:phosphoglycolate phosphatase